MPVAVAIAIRYIIMAAVQLGIWRLLEKYGIPLLNKAITELMVINGVSRETATAIMANKVIRAFEEVGIFAATLKTKMPIKVAELLGFTSKGYVVRTVSEAAGLTIEKTAVSATSKAVATTAEVQKIAEVVSKTSGWQIKGVGDLLKYVTLVVGTPVGFFYAFAQYIDYAAWQNPYQKTFEGLLGYIGIKPDTVMPKAGAVSDDTWKRIYSTIEQLKPVGMSFPFSDQDRPYSRANLADLTNEIAANLVKSGKDATYKNVIAVLLASLQFNGKEPKVPTFPSSASGTVSVPKTYTSQGTTTTTTKVFAGIVSQGVVSKGLVFEPRQDDLIESIAELRSAAANNLAPFLATLAGKVIYEVKVVSSVLTKDGFKQTGTTQRVQSGTYQNGTPKYKTVTNKFATLILYILNDKGSRTKLTTIVLGPVDSARLTVGENDLRELETQLPKDVITHDVKEITKVADESGNVSSVVINDPNETYDIGRPWTNVKGSGQSMFQIEGNTKLFGADESAITEREKWTGWEKNNFPILTKEEVTKLINDTIAYGGSRYSYNAFINETGIGSSRILKNTIINTNGSMPATTNNESTSSTTNLGLGANATTLYEWYQAQGQNVPSVEQRALIYAGYGLGQANFYTGTAEQNTKLLNALKSS